MPRPFVFQIRIIIRKNAKPVLSVTKGRKVSENIIADHLLSGFWIFFARGYCFSGFGALRPRTSGSQISNNKQSTAEIIKAQINAGKRRELYYFRDEQGLEVDFVLAQKGGAIALVGCKTSRTPMPTMSAPMQRLAAAMKKKRGRRIRVAMYLVHCPAKEKTKTHALAPGVQGIAWQEFLEQFLGE